MRVQATACLLVLSLFAVPALADTYSVSVGYADGVRGGGFFPGIWDGSPNTIFVGSNSPTGVYDAGAIMITNTGLADMTVTGVVYDLNHPTDCIQIGDPCGPVNLWGGPYLLHPGDNLVLTQTTSYNFDTSDTGFMPCGVAAPNGVNAPNITITTGGGTNTFSDSAHVTDTNGYDFVCIGNESFAWRPIGTNGTPAGVPEPASLVLFGTGLLGVGRKTWKRFIG